MPFITDHPYLAALLFTAFGMVLGAALTAVGFGMAVMADDADDADSTGLSDFSGDRS